MPASGLDYITQLENSSGHGGVFEYRSILTDLLGWVLERASGLRLPELLGREIWAPMGAEFDADVTVDRHGSALADGGICVALRDLGRFGQMYLQDGFFNGQAIVPREWVVDCRTGDEDARRAFAESPEGATMPGWFYRDKWWVKDAESGVFMGLGIYGQMVYVNQAAGMVGVKLSTLPVAWNDGFFEGTVRRMDALAEWLNRRAWPRGRRRSRCARVSYTIGLGTPGPLNAITDAAGVRVGCVTDRGDGPLIVGKGQSAPASRDRPHDGEISEEPLFAGCLTLNGNGEFTGPSIRESGVCRPSPHQHVQRMSRDAPVRREIEARGPGKLY
jgi:hypothetical protein